MLDLAQNSPPEAISYTVGFRQSKTALFDWTFLGLDYWILLVLPLIVSRVDFIVFVLFLEAVGEREYCCMAIEIGWQLCASRVLREQCVLRSRRTFVQAGWWPWAYPKAAKATFLALHSADSRHSYSRRRRCWQNGINNARCCRRVIHAAGMRS